MTTIIIDNVNNRSGAPVVGAEIAEAISAPILCIRQGSTPAYSEAVFGVRSDRVAIYPLAIAALLARAQFWRYFLNARVVVCNTSLTFAFVLLARVCGKLTILVLHESHAKNLLYRIAISISLRLAHHVITPSTRAYLNLGIKPERWEQIPNCLPPEYFVQIALEPSRADRVSILFVHGARPYKGGDKFEKIREFAAARGLGQLRFCSTADVAFAQEYAFDGVLRPDIYRRFEIVLVLTDNSMWKETFGLVGCEAAACGCVPLSTDRYAYDELWHAQHPELRLDSTDPEYVIERILALSRDPVEFDRLRERARRAAHGICDRTTFIDSWQRVTTVGVDRCSA